MASDTTEQKKTGHLGCTYTVEFFFFLGATGERALHVTEDKHLAQGYLSHHLTK